MRQIALAFIHYKGRAILSLLLILLSTIMSWYWLWGILILLWVVNDMLIEQVWLSETIAKSANPVLYHLILFVWLVFGFYFSLMPFANYLN